MNSIPELLMMLAAEPGLATYPAVTFYRGNTAHSRASYQELLEAVSRVAGAMAGMPAGRPVAVLGRNSVETVSIYLGVMASGATLVPLNADASARDWQRILGLSKAERLLVCNELVEAASRLGGEIPSMRYSEVLADAPAPAWREVPTGAPALLLFSSGTTGEPKGIPLTQRNLLANALSMVERFGLEQEVQLAIMPLCHAHAFGFGLLTTLLSRGHLVLMRGLDPFAWAEVIRREQVSVTSMVPTLLNLVAKLRVKAADVPSLRALLVSSAPLARDLAQRFVDDSGITLVHGWGLSEYTNFATCTDLGLEPQAYRRALFGYPFPTVGRALTGAELMVERVPGVPEKAGVEGELLVRGACQMAGYLGEADVAISAEGWLRTGDLGFYEDFPFGRYYFISGRKKELIIRAGEKLSPIALEQRWVERLPALQGLVVAVGFEHALQGEEVGAYIELPGVDLPPDELIAALGELPLLERPKVILLCSDPIPKTFTGKVLRRQLKVRFAPYGTYAGPVKVVRLDERALDVAG